MDWQQDGTLYYHIPKNIPTKKNIAAFDLDWTIAYGQKHLYPRDPDDIYILPGRKQRLVELHNQSNYNIVIFTNQYGVKKDVIQKSLVRVETLVKKLGIPCYVFVATGKDKKDVIDKWRKPKRGMWNKLMEYICPDDEQDMLDILNNSFYVGDAMGREQDFSSADILFANSVGIEAKTPEQYFGQTQLSFKQSEKDLVVLVGMPGSGKSTTYEEKFKPLGFQVVSQDQCKTRSKMMQKLNSLMKEGCSVVVDNTNPSQKSREEYYELAKELGYIVSVIYFVRNGTGWNNLRPDAKRVSTLAYIGYYSRLDPPSKLNTPGKVIVLV